MRNAIARFGYTAILPGVESRGTDMQGAPRQGSLAALAAIVVLLVTACSKEPESRQAKPNAPIKTPAPKTAAGSTDGPVDEALKERLARQEAASKMFERNVLQPQPPKTAQAKG